MSTLFILDADHNPVPTEDVVQWVEFFQKPANLIVGEDHLTETARVLTAFEGIHAGGLTSRQLFHSAIVTGDVGTAITSYFSHAEALAGHRWLVAQVRERLARHEPIIADELATAIQARTRADRLSAIEAVLIEQGAPAAEVELRAVCAENGYLHARELGDAGMVAISPLLFTHAIIAGLNMTGHEDRWCYDTYEKAKAALDAWDGTGEPTGWHRHPDSGRRIAKDGSMYVER